MKKILLFKLVWCVLLALCLGAQTSRAVILFGSGDPTYNTTPPTGALQDSGWQYEGQWVGFLGTPIAPQYFVAAKHVGGSVGDVIVFNGVSYATTAYWDDASTDLRIWKVNGTFPYYAPLYTTNNEQGKTQVVIGRGTQRGAPVEMEELQTVYTTNVVNMKALKISRRDALTAFPNAMIQGQTMTVVTSELVTNLVLKGWQNGPGDGVMRWGQNTVLACGSCLVAAFTGNNGPDEAYLSNGDSSGAVFIQDNGTWKLAGINYGVDGPFATSASSAPFYGAILDERNLYVGGTFVDDYGTPQPAYYYATRISERTAWIQSVISQ